MNRLTLAVVVGVSMLVGTGLSGCAKERAQARLDSSVATFRQNLDAMPANIDRTIAALTELRNSANTDPAASFRRFSQEFSWMQNRAAELGAQADRATANSAAFFREWTRDSMSGRSAAERQAAEERIVERRDQRDAALSLLSSGRTQYSQLANSLRDIQNDLRRNLSWENIQSMEPQMGRVVRQSVDVQNYIARLKEQIDAIVAGN